MAKNYVQPGNNIDFTTAGDVNSGDVIVAGNFIGIAANTTVGANKVNVLILEGVWTMAKTSAAITQGAKVYWNAAGKTISTTNTDPFIGYAAQAGDLNAATVQVKLWHQGS